MLSAIYVEEAIRDHPRTQRILSRYKDVPVLSCEHYGQIFNRSAQNFRLQKSMPALILARKENRRVMPAPQGYGIGEGRHYYFSHMLNCVYDCRYCFLQGMYRSAHYVLFVNYEEFFKDIIETVRQEPAMPNVYFYSGYDCDSLAFEPITGFAEYLLEQLQDHGHAVLELRTKSTQIRHLLSRRPIENCVVAFSLSPESVVDGLEHKTPSLKKRLDAIVKLQRHGWKVGLRFDPIIWHQDWQRIYADFFNRVFSVVDTSALHSVSLGAFRLPQNFFNNIVKLYPQEALFATEYENQRGMMSYPVAIEKQLLQECETIILKSISPEQYFPCFEESA